MIFMQGPGRFGWQGSDRLGPILGYSQASFLHLGRTAPMRLTIEIIAALLFLVCVSGSSAAFAWGDGKFYASYCGDPMVADM